MERPEVYPKAILDCRSYCAVWQSPDELVIRSKRQWWMIVLGVLAFAVVACGLFVVTIALYAEVFIARQLPLLGVACFAPFALLFLSLFCVLPYVLLQWFLVRTISIDFGRQSIEIRQMPLCREVFAFDDVQSVDLLLFRDNSGSACRLCVTRRDRPGLSWLVFASGYRGPEYYREELLPLGRLVARTLCCPLTWSWQRLAFLRIARGNESHEIPTADDEP